MTQEDLENGRLQILQNKPLPEYVSIIRIHGPFLFGTNDKLEQTDDVSVSAPIVILRLGNMTAIDATGLLALICQDPAVAKGRAPTNPHMAIHPVWR